MDRIILTGAAGFLGSHLAERFLDEGFSVLGIDNFLTGSRENLALVEKRDGFSLLTWDVSTPIHIEGPVAGVLHFASAASPPDYLKYPIETLKVGSFGTHNMIELARDKGARFLLASTSEVYGDPQIHPQGEDYWGHVNPVGPRAVYDEAKRFAEAMTMAYARAHGVDVRIARIFNTYGPRMRPDDGRVVSNFIVQALRNEPLTVYGDGGQTRSFCYVDDLVEGVWRLFNSEFSGPLNLGNPEESTVLELAKSVIREVGGGGPVEFSPLPQDDPRLRRPDISLANEILDWGPAVSLRDGLLKTIPYFREKVREEGAKARTFA